MVSGMCNSRQRSGTGLGRYLRNGSLSVLIRHVFEQLLQVCRVMPVPRGHHADRIFQRGETFEWIFRREDQVGSATYGDNAEALAARFTDCDHLTWRPCRCRQGLEMSQAVLFERMKVLV